MLRFRNFPNVSLAQKMLWTAPGSLKHRHFQPVPLRTHLCTPIFLPFAPGISRYSTATPASPIPPVPEKPRVSIMKFDIMGKIKEELHRLVSGSKQLGRNTKTAVSLMVDVAKGRTLARRERILLIQTVSDLLRMVPFIVILIVPFAEFALPVLLKVFPNMLPSTFVSASQKEATKTRTLQAKLEVIKVLQSASEDIVLRRKLDSSSTRESLISFMSRVTRGDEIDPQEVLQVSKNFHNEFSLGSLERPQLVSLAKFFGLPAIGTSFILQEEVKFKWNLVKQDDAHIAREGIDTMSPGELEEAAYSRGFNSTYEHKDKKQYLKEWIALSQENVPPYLLLLSRAHFFVSNTKQNADITPPIIAPYMPSTMQALSTAGPTPAQPASPKILVPEKELVNIEFKNLHHELSQDPVVAKLWAQIARFTCDLKKESLGDLARVIHLGDASGDKMSTVITVEMRQYMHTIFIALDKNCDGKLSADEVEHGFNASDIPVTHNAVVELIKVHDRDGDSCLSFDEFVDCLLYVRKCQQ